MEYRQFRDIESAVNAVHIQALIRTVSFVATLALFYALSVILLLWMLIFDLSPAFLLRHPSLALSAFGLTPLAATLGLWRMTERLICWHQNVYAKKKLKVKT